MLEPGNIDLRRTPAIRVDPEITDPRYESVSSVLSASSQDRDGREVLHPSVIHGEGFMSPDRAWQRYEQTGLHLGKFDTPQHADAYAEALHQQQEMMQRHESLAPKKALGGPTMPLPSAAPGVPYAARQSARELYHPGGLIDSPIAGRTDRIPMSVAANSYVIPADVVSGGGAQGNTLAGARVLDHAFKVGPYGTTAGKLRGGGRGIPHAPPPYHPSTMRGGFATGGVPHGMKDAVRIIAAGGEYVVPPHVVQHHPLLGNGKMRRGHEALDAYVKHVRSLTRKTLGKLPPPKRD